MCPAQEPSSHDMTSQAVTALWDFVAQNILFMVVSMKKDWFRTAFLGLSEQIYSLQWQQMLGGFKTLLPYRAVSLHCN